MEAIAESTQSALFQELPARPLVSIVVRTHGPRLGFLQEAYASIVAQEYRPIEVIVVEDGSSNAAEWIAEQQASLDSGGEFRLIYLPVEHGGRCKAGNTGLQAATGQLCGFLDDDDQFLAGHIEALVSALADNAQCGAAYAVALEVPTKIASLNPLNYQELGRYVSLAEEFDADRLTRRNITPIQCVLFRLELFEHFGGLDERLDALEDWDLWRRYAQAAPFAFVNSVTSLYRVPGDPEAARRRQLIFSDYQKIVERLWRVDPERTQLSGPHFGQDRANVTRQAREAAADLPQHGRESRTLSQRLRTAARDYLLHHPRLYACWWHTRLRRKRSRATVW